MEPRIASNHRRNWGHCHGHVEHVWCCKHRDARRSREHSVMRSLHPMRRLRRLGDETSTLIPSGLQPPPLSNSGGVMVSSGFVGPSYNSYLQKTAINKSLGGGVWVWANDDGSNQ